MNEKFRKELDTQLEQVVWTQADRAAVFEGVYPTRRPVRAAFLLAAAIVVFVALAGIGYAEYHSGILSGLFGERTVRQEAEDLLVFEPVTLTKDGITVTITEYLYDGQSMHISGEMRNDTDHALLCGMKDTFGGSGSGVFGLLSHLVMIQPGETAAGQTRIDDMNIFQKMLSKGQVEIQAVALRTFGEVQPDVNDTGYYDVRNHYGTDRTEAVFEETLSFPMRINQEKRASRTVPGVKEIRMEQYGYTLVMKQANFAAASSNVRFEVVPDDPKDILSYGEEGQDGHERLYRRYEILNERGERLFRGLTGGSGSGRTEDGDRMEYSFSFGPLERVPESIVLVPLNDDGKYEMDEAVTIPVLNR